jgi:hypothetical protein
MIIHPRLPPPVALLGTGLEREGPVTMAHLTGQ